MKTKAAYIILLATCLSCSVLSQNVISLDRNRLKKEREERNKRNHVVKDGNNDNSFGSNERGQLNPDRKNLQIGYNGKRAISKHNKRTIPESVEDTYLLVDSASQITKTFYPYESSHLFLVSTDSKDWSLNNSAPWIQCKNVYDTWFSVKVLANDEYEERKATFYVETKKHRVPINIIQKEAPISISATFNWSYVNHYKDELEIVSKVSIKNGKNLRCYVVATFLDNNGGTILAKDAKYSIGRRRIASTQTSICSITQKESNHTIRMSIPKSALLLLKKKNKLICHLSLYCEKTGSYISGAYSYIGLSAIKQEKGIKTSNRKIKSREFKHIFKSKIP